MIKIMSVMRPVKPLFSCSKFSVYTRVSRRGFRGLPIYKKAILCDSVYALLCTWPDHLTSRQLLHIVTRSKKYQNPPFYAFSKTPVQGRGFQSHPLGGASLKKKNGWKAQINPDLCGRGPGGDMLNTEYTCCSTSSGLLISMPSGPVMPRSRVSLVPWRREEKRGHIDPFMDDLFC